jgi:hypothetical protein
MIAALTLLICTGVAGAGLFTTGILLYMTPLIAVGIGLSAIAVGGMIVVYVYCQPQNQTQQTNQTNQTNQPIYSTNNMNTMKRNKSDTDLELINRQTAAYDESAPV